MRGGKKRIHELHPPFFLAELRWSSSPFLLPRKKNRVFFLIHRKLWLGCFDPRHLGVSGESGLSSCAPGGPGPPRGDFLGAGGGAGAEDAAAAAAAAAPGGADSAGEGGAAAAAGPWWVARSRPPGRKLFTDAGAAGAPSPSRAWPPGLPAGAARPDPAAAARRPGCPHAASSTETLLVAPGSLLVPRPPSPGARVLLPPPGARRAPLRVSGAGRSAARRRRAGSVSGSSLPRGERTEHGARLAPLARLGDRVLRAPSE